MQRYYDYHNKGLGQSYLKAYNEIETVQVLKHLTIEQIQDIKTFDFTKFNLDVAYETFADGIDDKSAQTFSAYLLYSVKLSDELPERYQLPGWQNCILCDAAIDQTRTYYIQCYPFECFIVRRNILPPQSWIDKNFDYQISPVTCQFLCKRFSVKRIEELRQMMSTNSFKSFILNICLQKYNNKYENVIIKFIDIAKEFVVDFFYTNNFVLDVFKQNNWQERTAQSSDKKIQGKTIFQYLLEKYCNTTYKSRNIIYKLQGFCYDGCLQQRICYQDFLLTPAQLYAYKFNIVAPDFLLYPGWEKEKVIDAITKSDLSFRQLYIIKNLGTMSQQLMKYYSDDSKDDKFIYQKLIGATSALDHGNFYEDYSDYDVSDSDDNSDNHNIMTEDFQIPVYVVGDSKDADTYWHKHEKLSKKFYEKYRITNNPAKYDKCLLCNRKYKELYNFCDNDHGGKGICMNCFIHKSNHYCPVCGDDIIAYDMYMALCRVVKNSGTIFTRLTRVK